MASIHGVTGPKRASHSRPNRPKASSTQGFPVWVVGWFWVLSSVVIVEPLLFGSVYKCCGKTFYAELSVTSGLQIGRCDHLLGLRDFNNLPARINVEHFANAAWYLTLERPTAFGSIPLVVVWWCE